MSTDEESADLVLCIHGTFASSGTEYGRGWWQRGSGFWKQFSRQLPSGTKLPEAGESLFRWSGANTERDRELAAVRLLAVMLRYERAGRHYHLIGHSHGGSLIWAALRLGCRRGVELKHLRSWSTVGTPFLNKQSLQLFHPGSILRCCLGCLLVLPCLTLSKFLLNLTAGVLHSEAPIWNMLGAMAIVGVILYLIVLILSIALGPLLESLQINRENKLDRRAMELYGQRWMGLWSPDDEAINALRSTLNMPLSFVGRYVPRERVFASDRLHALGLPHQWLLGSLYNLLIQPTLNRMVTRQVIKTLQGNNRPGGKVVAVHPWPTTNPLGREYPMLPGWLSERLLQRADQGARHMAPKLRQLLAASPLTVVHQLQQSVSGSEMVHTSYLEDEEIGRLLALHIAWAGNHHQVLSRTAENWPQGMLWFSRFKASLGAHVSTVPQAGKTWHDPDPLTSPDQWKRTFYAEIEDLIRDDQRSRQAG